MVRSLPTVFGHQTPTKSGPKAGYMRITPQTRQEIERLAKAGNTDAEIARICAVARQTARKYAAPVRPKVTRQLVLDERQLRAITELLAQVVKVTCPRCRASVMGLAFLPASRCGKCGEIVGTVVGRRPAAQAAPTAISMTPRFVPTRGASSAAPIPRRGQ